MKPSKGVSNDKAIHIMKRSKVSYPMFTEKKFKHLFTSLNYQVQEKEETRP